MNTGDEAEAADWGDDPRVRVAADVAAEIVNLHLDPSLPRSVVYGRVLRTILRAWRAADAEVVRQRYEPGRN